MFIGIIVIVVLIFLLAAGGIVGTLFYQLNTRKALLERNVSVLKKEYQLKEAMLKELAEAARGLAPAGDSSSLKDKVAELEERLRAEQGRLTITQAELEAVDSRLRELEEVERELEASAIESAKEVEMLRSQARDIENRNEVLKQQLQLSFDQIEILVSQFGNSQATVDQLNAMKTALVETQERIEYYSAEISDLNERYGKLKAAYDALDIEYAQLYEKHNAMQAASGS